MKPSGARAALGMTPTDNRRVIRIAYSAKLETKDTAVDEPRVSGWDVDKATARIWHAKHRGQRGAIMASRESAQYQVVGF